MKLRKVIVGAYAANCYILTDEKESKSAVIDPGDDVKNIINEFTEYWKNEHQNYCDSLAMSASEFDRDYEFIGQNVSVAANKEDGIVYFGVANSSNYSLSYYDLVNYKFIHNSSFVGLSDESTITFDGNFVHFAGKTFDKITGVKITDSDIARYYENITYDSLLKTIFDDCNISIFFAVKDSKNVIVVYDLTTNKELYSFIGSTSHVYKNNNTYVFLDDGTNIIRTLNLD